MAALRATLGGADRIGAVVGFALLLAPCPARAERDLTAQQSDFWYMTHAGFTGAFAALALGVRLTLPDHVEPRFTGSYRVEKSVEGNFSRTSGGLSDATLFASFAAPIAVLGSVQPNAGFPNALLIHAEGIALSVALNQTTKVIARRARPYLSNPDPAARVFAGEKNSDAALSFYSGHASTSFTSAVSGGMLFAALHDDEGARFASWAGMLGIASFTSHLRVRAGMHYPTDVVVGAAVGSFVGFVVPLAHEVRFAPTGIDAFGIAFGVASGTALGFLLPNRTARAFQESFFRVEPVPGGVLLGAAGAWD